MTEVEIEYCSVCQLRPQAMKTSEEILKNHESDIEAVRLKVGKDGVFKIRLDDEIIWDKKVEELDLDEVEKNLQSKLEQTAQA